MTKPQASCCAPWATTRAPARPYPLHDRQGRLSHADRQIFDSSSDWLDDDPVFVVKESLVADFRKAGDGIDQTCTSISTSS